MKKNTKEIENVITILNNLDIDYKTIEYIIKEIGMYDQIKRQISTDVL